MSEIRIGPFGFDYDEPNHELLLIRYADPVDMEDGEEIARAECVTPEEWEKFASTLLGHAIATASGKEEAT